MAREVVDEVNRGQNRRTLDLSKATPEQIAKAFKNELSTVDTVGQGVSVEVVPTDLAPLDEALGVGGVPIGRLIEVFGPEQSGKTAICMHVAGKIQQAEGKVAIIDAEHALDMEFTKTFGVDTS